MNIVIRTDASNEIGTGHVMRCLTLADMLATQGASVRFICRAFKGNLAALIQKRGFKVSLLPKVDSTSELVDTLAEYAHWLGVSQVTDAEQTMEAIAESGQTIDWLVVDHYAIDIEWENKLRSAVGQIMVIDDLADRRHDCDLLLDQNLYTSAANRYSSLVPDYCQVIIGPQHALLRPEFIRAKANLRQRDGHIRRILIQFGGVDASNETIKALNAVASLNRPDILVDVVVGSSNMHRDAIEKRCREVLQTTLHYQTKHVAKLMAAADLAIGAGGTTTWERCCMGVPSIIVAVAENQIAIGRHCDEHGVGIYLGTSETVTVELIAKTVKKFISGPLMVRQMSKRATLLVDGFGAGRVTDILFQMRPVLEGK